MATRQSKMPGDLLVAFAGLGTILALAIGIVAKKVEVGPASPPSKNAQSQVSTADPNAAEIVAPPPSESRAEIAVFGEEGTLRLTPLVEVPPRPKPKGEANCRNLESVETSAAGAIAHAAGWSVVSDESYGDYQVVEVQSGTRSIEGAGCVAEGTSVLVFVADTLIAVAYDSRRKTSSSSLARIERYSDSLIRLHALDGPLAEITLDTAAIRLRSLPPYDPICGGRSNVPRIERTSYLTVRQILKDEGWVPISSGGESVVSAELIQGGQNFWHATFRSPSGDDIVVMTPKGVNDENNNAQIDEAEDPLIGRFGSICAGTQE